MRFSGVQSIVQSSTRSQPRRQPKRVSGSLTAIAACLAACGPIAEPGGFDPDYCPPVEDWSGDWASFEEEVVALGNQARAAGATCGNVPYPAVPAVRPDAELRCAARNHSRDMAERGYFAHESPEGETPADRVERAGFDWTAIGENIALGYETPDEVMRGWLASPDHCANLMSELFEYVGVGYYDDGEHPTWTQDFARP